MAANDELPRGWQQFSDVGSTNAPSIIYPACPGVAWVLTDLAYSIFGAAGATAEGVTVNGAQWPCVAGVDGTAGSNSTSTWSGKYAFPIGTAVTISATGAAANRFADLSAYAYPT